LSFQFSASPPTCEFPLIVSKIFLFDGTPTSSSVISVFSSRSGFVCSLGDSFCVVLPSRPPFRDAELRRVYDPWGLFAFYDFFFFHGLNLGRLPAFSPLSVPRARPVNFVDLSKAVVSFSLLPLSSSVCYVGKLVFWGTFLCRTSLLASLF